MPCDQYSIAGHRGKAVSPVLKRSIVIAGHKTSISVEDEFWDSLREIAGERGTTLAAMIGAIDGDRKHANLSSAVRLLCLALSRSACQLEPG